MTTKVCEWCGKEFTAYQYRADKARYCSEKCYHTATQKHYTGTCLNCGKEMEVPTNHKNKKFCSNECAWEYRRNKPRTATTGKDGYRYVWFADGTGEKEHRYIIETRLGRKLGKDEVVHHIDGNRANNDVSNLVIMSRGEHSRLHRKLELEEGKVLFSGDK